MKNSFFPFLICLFIITGNLKAQQPLISGQDTLPEFFVMNSGPGKNIISWVNNFPVVKQISVQRSVDSMSNFKTILTVTDPMAVQNGYMDTRAQNDRMFYRIYIQLDKGQYLFSKSKRPYPDSLIKKKIGTLPLLKRIIKSHLHSIYKNIRNLNELVYYLCNYSGYI